MHEEKKKLAAKNRPYAHLLREGTKVKAIYEDEENEPAVSSSSSRRRREGD